MGRRAKKLSIRARCRRFGGRLLVVLLPLGLAALWVWWAVEASPPWWRPPHVIEPQVQEAGDRTEMFVLEQLHKVRPADDPWRFRLRNLDMNAWLAANLPDWFEHETGDPWPEGVSVPQVAADGVGFNLGLRLDQQFGGRIITLRLTPSLVDDQLVLQADRVSVGRLSVPGFAAESAVSILRDALGDQVDADEFQRVMDIAFGRRPLSPVVELTDGRIVRVESIEIESDAVVFTCRTLPDDPRMQVDRSGDDPE